MSYKKVGDFYNRGIQRPVIVRDVVRYEVPHKISHKVPISSSHSHNEDPKVWGPRYWYTLHNSSLGYPESASDVVKERMKGYILGLPVTLRCESCREHATAHIESIKHNLDHICSGRDNLFKFYVDFHNIVNRRHKKSEMSYEDAYRLYK